VLITQASFIPLVPQVNLYLGSNHVKRCHEEGEVNTCDLLFLINFGKIYVTLECRIFAKKVGKIATNLSFHDICDVAA
jgi:hypothetical protein